MFWIFSSGLLMMIMPLFLSSLMTRMTALRASFSDLAPVHTIFPELKIRVAVLGRLSRKTKPGNCSGRYSTPGYPFTTAFRSTRCFRVAEATTFSMLMDAFTFGIYCGTFERYILHAFIYKGL